jgi:uncharacterized phiE125 gp8 family phage protein
VKLKLVTPPSVEPVTLTEAKAHLGETGTSNDTLITGLIVAARQACEHYARRAFVTQTYDLALDGVSGNSIELPRPPLASVTSVTYYLEDGTSGTVSSDDYLVDDYGTPGRLTLKRGASWPTGLRETNGLVVRFVAGFGLPPVLPQPIKEAVLVMVAALFAKADPTVLEERIGDVTVKYAPASDLPDKAKALLRPYRVVML